MSDLGVSDVPKLRELAAKLEDGDFSHAHRIAALCGDVAKELDGLAHEIEFNHRHVGAGSQADAIRDCVIALGGLDNSEFDSIERVLEQTCDTLLKVANEMDPK